MVAAQLAGVDGRNAQEEEVAPGDEGVGVGVGGLGLVHREGRVGQGVVSQLPDEGYAHLAEVHFRPCGYGPRQVYFPLVLLSVAEAEGVDVREVFFGPVEARGGVLPAAEDDERMVMIHSVLYEFRFP